MPSYLTVRWVTENDESVCPVCRALEKTGIWVLDTLTKVPSTLDDRFYGPVWDGAIDASLAHTHLSGSYGECRCHLEYSEPDCTDLRKMIQELIKIYQDHLSSLQSQPEPEVEI